MTCTKVGNAIVCTSPWGRLHVGNKYVMVDYHQFCGPSFFTDRAMQNIYDPVDEHDPVWPVFQKWFDKRFGKQLKQEIADAQWVELELQKDANNVYISLEV